MMVSLMNNMTTVGHTLLKWEDFPHPQVVIGWEGVKEQ
jgi:hypothetical protein